jgi:hypothetical protein
MRTFVFVLALGLIAGSAAAEDWPILTGGGGGFLPLDGDRVVVWEDPPNLEGLIGSSEQILSLNLESELANDFFFEVETTVREWTWWGGYFNYVPGDPLITAFNLWFYNDGGYIPGDILANPNILDFDEEFIYDQGGFPIYEYHCCFEMVFVPNLYWFTAQADDHPFPPQWGRLAAEFIQAVDTMFKSPYFGVPDWLPATVVFGEPYEASQRLGDVCGPVPTEETSWGAIKVLFQ